MGNNKHILVVSNNCFSPSNSNGRTLGNLFHGWPKKDLAQMCVIANDPAWDVCDNYYCLEDRIVLNAFLHGKKAIGRKLRQGTSSERNASCDTQKANIGKKTLPKVMLREMVWAFNRWKSKDFEDWVDGFNPDAVVLQFGDSSFMIDISLYIAKSRKIPLIIYNTEGYYFFDKFWHTSSAFDAILFPFYKHGFHKRVKKLMDYASYSIYLNAELKDDYDYAFNKPSTVIYNSSSLHPCERPPFYKPGAIPNISYLGGLGHGRDKALIEVGDVLHNLNIQYHIDVFGPADKQIAERLKCATGVEYHGSVSYERVKEVINDSDILFHVEPISHYNEQLKYAFSGKIADSVTSGKCFVLYAPKELSCSNYIIDNMCGWYAESKEDLHDVLLRVIHNDDERVKVLKQAQLIAEKYHNYEGNAKKFQAILKNVCNNEKLS